MIFAKVIEYRKVILGSWGIFAGLGVASICFGGSFATLLT